MAKTGNTTNTAVEEDLKPHVIFIFILLYSLIWIVGMFGNIMVLYVVIKYKKMRTTINNFIACLSVSDLAICLVAIPFTPLNALINSWPLGNFLCKFIPLICSASVFFSTFISMIIAIDRFVVILFPHKRKMSSALQVVITVVTAAASLLIPLPSAIYSQLNRNEDNGNIDCTEQLPKDMQLPYSWVVLSLQLIIPAAVLIICYTAISLELHKRMKIRAGLKNAHSKTADAQHVKINRMLIAMVTIFIICWLPIEIFHLFSKRIPPNYIILVFLITHVLAMSSVMYNPLVYGWMNENFYQYFQKTLPFLYKRKLSGETLSARETFNFSAKEQPTEKQQEENGHLLLRSESA